jgi:peptidoglycan/xylan/chitin deacetylase (PgdA/CDA1 family)
MLAHETQRPRAGTAPMSTPLKPAGPRRCACGGAVGSDGMCGRCRQNVLQRLAFATAPSVAPPIVHDVLSSAGRPLDAGVRAELEPRFGHSFADVRVHADDRAAESARAVAARAYTVGRDVVFAAGRYAPRSAEGRHLIAHELAHVVQQRGASPSLQPWLEIGAANDPAEHQAERAAAGAGAPGTATGTLRLQRSVEDDGLGPAMRGPRTGEPALRHGSTLPYREATELAACLRIMGPENAEYCREQVLGETSGGAAKAEAKSKAKGKAAGTTRTFALTFDDGPHTAQLGKGINRTEKVLDVLKGRSIKGAFFIQTGVTHRGNNPVGRALVKRMQTDGHKIGIHTGGTTDHELHTTAAKAGRLEGELEDAKSYVKKETGTAATLVRPPTGAFNKAVSAIYAKTGLTNLLWDMDGDQGKDLSLADLKARVVSEMTKVKAAGWKPTTPSPHIVVLYHDIQKGTANNLDAVIDHIKQTTSDLSGGKESAAFAPP